MKTTVPQGNYPVCLIREGSKVNLRNAVLRSWTLLLAAYGGSYAPDMVEPAKPATPGRPQLVSRARLHSAPREWSLARETSPQ